MKKTILYAAFIAMLSGTTLTSCEDLFGDFLDKQPSNELTEEETFSLWSNATKFHFDTYNFLRHGACRINNSWMDSATDLAETSYSTGGTRNSFNIGNYYANSGAPELTDTWELYFRGIRKCNMLLTHIDSVPKPTSDTEENYQNDLKNFKAESRFLRAYFYWELYLRYGPLPIITDVLDPDGDLLSGYTERPTNKVFIDFVLTELTECETGLMEKPMGSNGVLTIDNNLSGRICKPMASALRSRIILYMASPHYQKIYTAEGSTPITWEAAANAAKSFIETYGNQYGLYYGTSNDPLQQYQEAILLPQFNGNNEIIFWRNDTQVGWSAISNDTPVGEGGNGGLCPSQNLVDMYDMANGLSPFSQYDETGAPVYNGTNTPAINQESGYDDAHPYANRDPRFYRTVLYQQSIWNNAQINVIKGGRDNPVGNANATPTGYYVRKYIPETILSSNHSLTAYRNWIIIRYAEILLNYAEAMNEVNGPSDEVFNALQKIRDRVGMTAKLSARTDLQTKDALRNFIRKERTVELAFEDHRAWDVRRWDVAIQALTRPIYGIEVTSGTDGNPVYTRKIAQNRVFKENMYLYPIPESEEWKTNIENNPGW
ncbi:RagB/SusD family nutrient uptake outer membrane protein [uncultured Bacteroides sp.]|uniref:RagB/SusD family nutrient uptake outer membrane protein n=1 Tax=uncultured Bacteroides sp. TaxID=162156 RepID=UPI002AA8E2F7|nr:RagB/SusD family nutrient uptake outer membrane protein [uncultured Bacteroides sp.]